MTTTMNRRQFVSNVILAVGAQRVVAQAPEWGGPVLDIHLHLRPNIDANLAHIDGSGVAKAVLLTNVSAAQRASDAVATFPDRFVWFASVDVRLPDAEAQLTQAVKDG